MRGLGSAKIAKGSYIFLCDDDNLVRDTFRVRVSEDGLLFRPLSDDAKIVNITGPTDAVEACTAFHMSQDGQQYFMTYYVPHKKTLGIAQSRNLIDWEKACSVEDVAGGAKIVSDYLYAGRTVMVAGGDALRLYVTSDGKRWVRAKRNLIDRDDHDIKNGMFMVLDAQVIDDGVFVLYALATSDASGATTYAIHGALFAYGDPTRIAWRTQAPVYAMTPDTYGQATLFGAGIHDEYFVSYWMNEDGELFLLRHPYTYEPRPEDMAHGEQGTITAPQPEPPTAFTLERAPDNPLLTPNPDVPWESKATYNPTAFLCGGHIHIIYRADGDDNISVWGHALSPNGIDITNRSKNCIFRRKVMVENKDLPRIYASGINVNGGCEDPRAVVIDGTVYVTFTAFDGWSSVRMALTSIDLNDFLQQRWHWKKTRLISPAGEMNKNWVLFSEKVNGKFAILHSFYPKILIDYFDDLDELDGKTRFIRSNNTRPFDTARAWDSWFRGVGPPPIKTKDGWLVLYHAMMHNKPDRYRIGALLLDLDDPTKVLYRSTQPILEPQEHYENHGHKWGVVFTCGAVVKDGTLFVYYGGADACVCVATAPIDAFLHDLKQTGVVRMTLT